MYVTNNYSLTTKIIKMPDSKPSSRPEMVSVIKEYISPILITVIGMFVWRDMSEMRNDIKTLLANQSANQVKIETLQADVTALKAYVYNSDFQPFVEGTRISIPNKQPAKKEDDETPKIVRR